jgi:CHASE1-domain containing sensor protein
MGKKILLTIIILLTIVLGSLIMKLTVYEVTQEYARTAVEQLDNDESYTILQSQGIVYKVFKVIHFIVIVLLLYWGIKIWIPKKKE